MTEIIQHAGEFIGFIGVMGAMFSVILRMRNAEGDLDYSRRLAVYTVIPLAVGDALMLVLRLS